MTLWVGVSEALCDAERVGVAVCEAEGLFVPVGVCPELGVPEMLTVAVSEAERDWLAVGSELGDVDIVLDCEAEQLRLDVGVCTWLDDCDIVGLRVLG